MTQIKVYAPDGSGYSERKVKTYVLTITKTFPKTHPKAGEATGFENLVWQGRYSVQFGLSYHCHKIHTIRSNYDLWAKRFIEIYSGNAVLSVREWTGKPYRSKQRELFRFDSSDGIGIQILRAVNYKNHLGVSGVIYMVNSNSELGVGMETLAKNDGLLLEDFKNWFKGYDLSKPMAIIHFTDFRY